MTGTATEFLIRTLIEITPSENSDDTAGEVAPGQLVIATREVTG
ncbi:hypothetical protein [Spirosoma endophyticum]|uniref:Uncharacterized protein n=1 Tax=Spirosoma endophyticum TaxID=662367 RepID=A0A1I1HIY7_9BACT|nr:hypothetical protein [Spirosoma endophyticum]SFC23532.1 hypothetical protein SAMN05216167_101708 [Spirosoma endophyticum]